MENPRVIRVNIDQSTISATPESAGPRGFLHEELEEFRCALEGDGGLAMFQLPDWFHKAKTAVVKNVTPASEEVQFHQKVQADMKAMLQLLDSMATMMSAWKPPGTAARGAPIPVGKTSAKDDEEFYLIQSQ